MQFVIYQYRAEYFKFSTLAWSFLGDILTFISKFPLFCFVTYTIYILYPKNTYIFLSKDTDT